MALNYKGARCKKCIMPPVEGHIVIMDDGICNICHKYNENAKRVGNKFDDKSSMEKFITLKKS